MFTETVRYAVFLLFAHEPICLQAHSSAQFPKERISPVSSAKEMNSPGNTMPRRG
jgi:hypothetical protein